MADAFGEVRLALRALRNAPAFALTVIGTLGLAIGASAAIFTLVDSILLTPLPYSNPDGLVMLRGSAPGTDVGEDFGLSTEFLIEYQENADLLDGVAAYNLFTSTLRTDERVDRVLMSSPTPSLFTMLGVQPLIGRLPVDEDVDRVVILSHRLWIEWFDGDPNVIGRSYSVAGQTRTVIGVMPPDFAFPAESITLWFPNPIAVAVASGQTQIRVGNFGLPLVARVKPGVEPDALIAQLDLIASRLPEKYGGSPAYAQ